jgi:hypothetical protein
MQGEMTRKFGWPANRAERIAGSARIAGTANMGRITGTARISCTARIGGTARIASNCWDRQHGKIGVPRELLVLRELPAINLTFSVPLVIHGRDSSSLLYRASIL